MNKKNKDTVSFDHHQLIEWIHYITHIRLLQRGTPNTNQVPLCLWPDGEIEGYSRREAGSDCSVREKRYRFAITKSPPLISSLMCIASSLADSPSAAIVSAKVLYLLMLTR